MEIGVIYSSSDPRQIQTLDFVRTFVSERGILAHVVETVQPVKSPTVIIDGHSLCDRRHKPREENAPMYPGLLDVARTLERHLWGP